MAEAERDLKIHLTLTEREAQQICIHLDPKYSPNDCSKIKDAIHEALGYEPQEAPDL